MHCADPIFSNDFIAMAVRLAPARLNIRNHFFGYNNLHIGRIGMEQRIARVHSQFLLLRVRHHPSTGRLAGISLRRQARLRNRRLHHSHCYTARSNCSSYTCVFTDRAESYHGIGMCTYFLSSCYARARAPVCVRTCNCKYWKEVGIVRGTVKAAALEMFSCYVAASASVCSVDRAINRK